MLSKAVYPFSVDTTDPQFLHNLSDVQVRLLYEYEHQRNKTGENVYPTFDDFLLHLNRDMVGTENNYFAIASSALVTEVEMNDNDPYTEVRSNFVNENNEVCIDAWKTDDDNEEGATVARVDTEYGHLIWVNPQARFSRKVQEVVDEVLADVEKKLYDIVSDDDDED